MALKKIQEKEFAKSLYIGGGISQKEIAERISVTEKTLSKWIKEDNWDTLKKSLLTTKKNQLSELYDQLELKTSEIKNRKIIYDVPTFMHKPIKVKNSAGDEVLEFIKFKETDYPIKTGNTANTMDADIILKITTSIKRLETETSIGDIVEVARNFIEFVRPQNLELAKQITNYFDVFITSKMK